MFSKLAVVASFALLSSTLCNAGSAGLSSTGAEVYTKRDLKPLVKKNGDVSGYLHISRYPNPYIEYDGFMVVEGQAQQEWTIHDYQQGGAPVTMSWTSDSSQTLVIETNSAYGQTEVNPIAASKPAFLTHYQMGVSTQSYSAYHQATVFYYNPDTTEITAGWTNSDGDIVPVFFSGRIGDGKVYCTSDYVDYNGSPGNDGVVYYAVNIYLLANATST